MKQIREAWRSCTRDNVEADESYFVLNLAADSVIGTIASGDCKGVMWADLGALQTRRAEQLITR